METRGKSVEVLAYAAGVVDSDGCIGITKRAPQAVNRRVSPAYQGYITVTNTSLELLNWFEDEFGGSRKNRTQVLATHKRCYNWAVTNTAAAAMAELLIPYLKVKGAQAKLIIELHDVHQRYLGRRGQPRNMVNGHLTGFVMPAAEVARREALYQQAKTNQDDRRPQRLSGKASRTDEATVCADAKAPEREGTETVSPRQGSFLG